MLCQLSPWQNGAMRRDATGASKAKKRMKPAQTEVPRHGDNARQTDREPELSGLVKIETYLASS